MGQCCAQALAAARGAVAKLEATGTKWQRPPDYYAEMVKSDEHMARVKAQLMHEQSEIEGAQERWGSLPCLLSGCIFAGAQA